MPSFGMYTAEGTLVNWLHPEGTRVAQGEPILEIETEKAVNQVVAPGSGLLQHRVKVGTLVKEEGLLGYILNDQELTASGRESQEISPVSKPTPTDTVVKPQGVVSNNAKRATPIARRLAAEHGIDLAAIAGSGPGGRIVESDVMAAVPGPAGRPALGGTVDAETLRPATIKAETGTRIPLTKLRKAISDRLLQSARTAVSVTLTREVEAEHLIAARQKLAATLAAPVPYEAFFMKLLAQALKLFPELNAFIEGEDLLQPQTIDIGFAVAISGGVQVPIVRNVDRASARMVVDEIRRLAKKAQDNALTAGDTVGGSSTITNLGRYGVDAFTPVLNPPQSSILGIGRIAQRPVVRGGSLVVAPTCWLSLTFDHRVTDGVPAAQVLEAISEAMQDSDSLLSLF